MTDSNIDLSGIPDKPSEEEGAVDPGLLQDIPSTTDDISSKYHASRAIDPDARGSTLQLAEKTGLPPDVVDRNKDEAKSRAEEPNWYAWDPDLVKAVNETPEAVVLSKGDNTLNNQADTMKQIGQVRFRDNGDNYDDTLEATKKSLQNFVPYMQESMTGIAAGVDAYTHKLGAPTKFDQENITKYGEKAKAVMGMIDSEQDPEQKQRMMDAWGIPNTHGDANLHEVAYQIAKGQYELDTKKTYGARQQILNDMMKDQVANLQKNAPNVQTWSPAWAASSIIDSSAKMLPGIATSFVAGPEAGLAMFAAPVFGDTYAQEKAKGTPDDYALEKATFTAAAEAIPETLGLESIKTFGKAAQHTFAQSMVHAGMAEGTEELVSQVAEQIYGQVREGQKITWMDALDQYAQAFFLGAVIGAPLGGLHHMASASMDQKNQEDIAKKNSDLIQQAIDEASKSKLRDRDPGTYEQVISQLQSNHADKNVYIPADKFVEHFQSDAEDVAGKYGDIDQFKDAVVRNGDVEIPFSSFLAYLAKDHGKDLAPYMKLAPQHSSIEEAKQNSEAFSKNAVNVMQQFNQSETASSDREAQLQQVYDDVKKQLLKNPMYTESTASKTAMLFRSRIDSVTSRIGKDPWDYYRSRPVEIMHPGKAKTSIKEKPAPNTADVKPQPSAGESVVSTASGGKVNTKFELVNLPDLVTSDNSSFPKELQPRERDRAASQRQIEKIVNEFDPTRLGHSTEADRGSPIVGDGNVVESGNGRVMAIRKVYEGHPEKSAAYKEWLKSQGHDISGMDQPVLVRRRTSAMDMEQRRAFVVDANTPATASMSSAEQAKADQDVLTPDVLALYQPADITSPANADFVRAFMAKLPVTRLNEFIGSTGHLTSLGVLKIQNAILGKAYGGTENSDRVLQRLTESTDDNVKAISGALLDAAPQWAMMRDDVKAGVLPADFDITHDLVVAVETVSQARDENRSIDEVIKQAGMFGDRSAATDELIRSFYNQTESGDVGRAKGRPKVAKQLVDYIAQSEAYRTDQMSMIPAEPTTPDKLVRDIARQNNEASKPQITPQLFGFNQEGLSFFQHDYPGFDKGANADWGSVAPGNPIIKALVMPTNIKHVDRSFREIQVGKTLDDIYASAEADQADLVSAAKEISDALSDMGVKFLNPGVKGRKRAQEKAEGKYAGQADVMTDIVRGGFITPTLESAQKVADMLIEKFPVYDEGWGTTDQGYFDRKLLFRTKGGLVGEIQLWEPTMLEAKKSGGHDLYDTWRALPANDPQRIELNNKMLETYSKAASKMDAGWKEVYQFRGEGSGGNGPYINSMSASDRTGSVSNQAESIGTQAPSRNTNPSSEGWRMTPANPPSTSTNDGAERAAASDISSTSNQSIGQSTGNVNKSLAETVLDAVTELVGKVFNQSGFQDDKTIINNPGPVAAAVDAAKAVVTGQKPPPRAAIRFYDNRTEIELFGKADLTSMLHEGGHQFIEETIQLAKEYPVMQQELDGIMKWLGVDSPDKITDTHHERFAKAFELYLREGKAPSIELRSAFAAFKAWLIAAYRNFQAYTRGVRLNDDIRAVMDRMVATDDQIEAARKQGEFDTSLASAADDIMTPEERVEYLKAADNAKIEAQEQLMTKAMADVAREAKAWWKAEKDRLRTEIAADLAKEPVYAVQDWMRSDAGERMNREQVIGIAGEEAARKLSNMTAAEGGLHPDEVAQLFGFTSGDQMIQAIINTPAKTKLVEDRVRAEMIQRHGDILNDGSIGEAANEAIHNKAREHFLDMEAKILARKSNRPPAPAAIIRKMAEQAIAKKTVREILRTSKYLAAEARAATAYVRAIAKKDFNTAMDQKRIQIINQQMYRQALKAKEEVRAARALASRLAKAVSSGKIDKDYGDQIENLLERFEFKQVSDKRLAKRRSLAKWIEDQPDQDSVVIPDYVRNELYRINYRDMTIDDLRGVVDSLKNIEHLGRLKNKLLTDQKRADLESAVADGVASIEDNAKKTYKDQPGSKTTPQVIAGGFKSAFAWHRKFSSIIRQLDGYKDNGVMWNLLSRGMNISGDNEAQYREKATIDLEKIFEPIVSSKQSRARVYIPEIDASMTRENIMMAMMNMGTAENKQRLLDGNKWNEQQAQAVIAKLTKEETDFVQSVLDYLGTFKDEIARQQVELTGLQPEWVDAVEIETPHGKYKGGYLPIKYDADRSSQSLAEEAANNIAQLWRAAKGFAKTKDSFTKKRAEKVMNRPLRNDFGVVFQHVNEVTHRLAWENWIRDARKLINTSGISEAIRKHHGPEVLRELNDTIKDIAIGDIPAQNAFEKSMQWIRTGATVSGLAWRFTTAMMQPLGLTQSMVRIGPKYVGRGMANWIGSAVHMENKAKEIMERSPFMRLRHKTMQREISEIRNQVVGNQSRAQVAIHNSYFWAIHKMQMVADIPTWLGAYEKAFAEHADMTEQDAILLADQAVIDAQGAGQIKDLAAAQRGGPLLKLFTNFYSYFSTTFNLTAESIGRTNFKKPEQIAALAGDFLLLYTVPAMLGYALKAALGGAGGDDDKDMAEILAREHLTYMAGTMVGLRDLSSIMSGFSYSGPTGLRFYNELGKLMQQASQGETDEQLLKSINDTAGVLFHYPAGQLDKTFQGMHALVNGETHNPMALLTGYKE